jgi:hypothetical protein
MWAGPTIRSWPEEIFCKKKVAEDAEMRDLIRSLRRYAAVETRRLEEATRLVIDDPPPNPDGK